MPGLRSVLLPIALVSLCPLSACSKGGVMVPEAGQCRSILDPEPDPNAMPPPPPPSKLYAELKHQACGTVIPVDLQDATGGDYTGTTRNFARTDPQGAYYLDRTVLAFKDMIVAVATRDASNNYRVTYPGGGGPVVVSGSGFTSISTSFGSVGSGQSPTVSALSASPIMAAQGDMVTVTATAMAAMDDCGMGSMLFALSPLISPGGSTSPATTPAVIMGSATSGSFRVPPTLTPDTYFVEGSATSKSGRTTLVRRRLSNDTTYSLYINGSYMPTSIQVVKVTVMSGSPDAIPPTAVSMSASPTMVSRCQQVGLVLAITDDRGLPASQDVRVRLGPISQPGIVTATVKGKDMLSGTFTVPIDAPAGIWFAYPESVRDAAGNVAAGTPSPSGDKFTLGGSMIASATFTVQGDTSMLPFDAGITDMSIPRPPDMAMTLPATLTNITITPSSLSEGTPAQVRINWMAR